MTLEAIKRQIKTSGDLLSVVKTMKSLASVNIRQYEEAVRALDGYSRAVGLAWLALFRVGGVRLAESGGPAVVLVIGSDQGMAGPFNDVALQKALEEEPAIRGADHGQEVVYWASGERALAGLVDAGRDVALHFSLPGSLSGIDAEVLRIIEAVEKWQRQEGVMRYHVVSNRPSGRAAYGPVARKLLPLDKEWSGQFEHRSWPARNIPMLGLSPEDFSRRLFGQYLYIELFRAYCQSLAGENAARLAAMQSAEKNIEEMRERLTMDYRQERQTEITSELLDVISGFEALQGQGGEE